MELAFQHYKYYGLESAQARAFGAIALSPNPNSARHQEYRDIIFRNGVLWFMKTTQLNHLALFALFLFCDMLVFGLLVFVAPQFQQKEIQVISQICITVAFLLCALWLHRNKQKSNYFQITFAFFIGSFVMLLNNLIELSGSNSVPTVNGYLLLQIMETLVIVIPIILLTKFSGNNMGSIYLQKGRLRLGLLIGLGTFLFFPILIVAYPTGLSYASMLFNINTNITYEKLLSLLPIAMVFVLLNGFKEELLNRGIFLKKLEPFLGAWPSNILTAFVFAVTHVGVGYTPALLIFLVITFILGLAWGYVMQKTDSIIGSALFHGAMDITIILGIFSFL